MLFTYLSSLSILSDTHRFKSITVSPYLVASSNASIQKTTEDVQSFWKVITTHPMKTNSLPSNACVMLNVSKLRNLSLYKETTHTICSFKSSSFSNWAKKSESRHHENLIESCRHIGKGCGAERKQRLKFRRNVGRMLWFCERES